MENNKILDKDGNKIKVQLVGTDGNAFAVLAACDRAMVRGGVPQSTRDAFYHEATSGDYDNLLRTAMKYLDVT